MKKIFRVLQILSLSLAVITPVLWAESGTRQYDLWNKFGRGLGNIAGAPFELVYQPYYLADTERVPLAIFGGIGKGIAYACARVVVGVFEVATFPVPIPKEFKPIIQPEFVIPQSQD